MARSRNIKPGFFVNEQLVELPFEVRLLFIGIWTLADREGRLEDRPKKIKIAIFPADDVDVDNALDRLAAMGFIVRYTRNGVAYIAIPTWCRHQNPHSKEAKSLIPAPGVSETGPVQAPCKAEPKPGQTHGNNETITSRARLIPDSGFLIPDSPPLEDATASGLNSSDPDRAWLWCDGVKLLVQRSGIPDRKVRSCIGRWLKKHAACQVRLAIVLAERAQTGDPVPYITRILGRETELVDAMMVGLE